MMMLRSLKVCSKEMTYDNITKRIDSSSGLELFPAPRDEPYSPKKEDSESESWLDKLNVDAADEDVNIPLETCTCFDCVVRFGFIICMIGTQDDKEIENIIRAEAELRGLFEECENEPEEVAQPSGSKSAELFKRPTDTIIIPDSAPAVSDSVHIIDEDVEDFAIMKVRRGVPAHSIVLIPSRRSQPALLEPQAVNRMKSEHSLHFLPSSTTIWSHQVQDL